MKRAAPYLLIVLAVALAALLERRGSSAPIMAAGSSTVEPLLRNLARAWVGAHPEVRFEILGGGSSRGVEAARDGAVDLGMVSRPLTAAERDALPDIAVHSLGTDAIAILVHESNPVRELGRDDVRRAYLGQITNWSELGGPDLPLRPLTHGTNHGTYQTFVRFFDLQGRSAGPSSVELWPADAGPDTAPASVRAYDGHGPILAAVARDPRALAYGSVTAARQARARGMELHVLALDGVDPDPRAVRDGRYPFGRPLLLLAPPHPRRDVARFLDWVGGAEVRALVESWGYAPPAALALPR